MCTLKGKQKYTEALVNNSHYLFLLKLSSLYLHKGWLYSHGIFKHKLSMSLSSLETAFPHKRHINHPASFSLLLLVLVFISLTQQ